MNSLNRDQWREVDERLRNIYEIAASTDDRSDFDCLLPAIHSELEKVRHEAEDNMRKRCLTTSIHSFANLLRDHYWDSLEKDRDLITQHIDEIERSYLDQATQNINNLDKE